MWSVKGAELAVQQKLPREPETLSEGATASPAQREMEQHKYSRLWWKEKLTRVYSPIGVLVLNDIARPWWNF